MSKYVWLALCLVGVQEVQGQESTVRLVIPDGQYRSDPVEVFVDFDVSDPQPELNVFRRKLFFFEGEVKGDGPYSPVVIATGQTFEDRVLERGMQRTGTMMLFDLTGFRMHSLNPMVRVIPVLTWSDSNRPGQKLQAIGDPVLIGNRIPVALWSMFVVTMIIVAIAVFCKLTDGRFFPFLNGPNGYLSLSRNQVVAWTVATGGVVFAFGLVRLEIPRIPVQIIALMGLSLVTGGISYMGSGVKTTRASVPPPLNFRNKLAGLVSDVESGEAVVPSLPKVQMLFWTILTLLLFVTKSVMEGKLWEVPWEMVALMGMSQAGYLSPMFMKKGSEPPSQQPDPKPETGSRSDTTTRAP